MDKDLKEYRSHLILAEQKTQEDYDKTVIALSGGALGLSFAFLTDIVGPDLSIVIYKGLILWAWIAWGTSLTAVLISYLFAHKALRQAIDQIDAGKIYQEKPGGISDRFTEILNWSGAIFFITGLIFMGIFVYYN